MTLQNCLSQTMYICTADESLKKSLQNTTYFHIRLLQWHIGPPFRNQEGVGDSIDDSASSFSPISGRPLRLCGLLWSLWSSFPLLTFVKTAEGYATERFRDSILTRSVRSVIRNPRSSQTESYMSRQLRKSFMLLRKRSIFGVA